MKPRDLFGLGVRLFGLWLVGRGLTYVASFADLKLYPTSNRDQYGAAGHLIYAILDFSAALLFLLKADWVVGLSYAGPGDARPARPATDDPFDRDAPDRP